MDKDSSNENKDEVYEFQDGEKINPEDIIEEEVIDKDKEKEKEIKEENEKMEIDLDNEQMIKEKGENEDDSFYEQEFPDFSTKGEIYCIALHQKTGTAIIGDGEDTTTFYDLSNKKIILSQKLNKDSVNFLKFSNDNKYLASTSIDGTINLFDAENNFKLIETVSDQNSEINWIDWHPKGPAFDFGTAEGAIWIYMANNTSNNFNFYSHTSPCTCGCFINEGKNLASGGEDSSVKIYDLKNKNVLYSIKGKKFHQGHIICLTKSDKKPLVISASDTGEMGLINYKNGNILFFTNFNECTSIEAITFCNDEQYVTFCDSSNKVNIFDMNLMQLRGTINLKDENINKIIPSTKRNYEIYCSGSNGHIYIIDTRGKGSIIQKEKVHSDIILDFVMTKDEDYILTCSLDKTINLLKNVEIN